MRRLVLLDSAWADLRRIQVYISRASGRRATGETFALRLLGRCEGWRRCLARWAARGLN